MFGAYAAGNAFMDAFAANRSRRDANAWISVDWDGWDFGPGDGPKSGLAEFAMAPEQGGEAFSRIVSGDLPARIVVSTGDLNGRYERYVRKTVSGSTHQRPALEQKCVAPRNDIESVIAGVWQDLFGIQQVGAFDDFFELGGHSLLATQVISRLRRAFTIDLPMASIFEAPTPAALADVVLERLLEQQGIAEPLIADVQRLSAIDIERELSRSASGVPS